MQKSLLLNQKLGGKVKSDLGNNQEQNEMKIIVV